MPLPEEKDARVILEQSNMAPDKPVKEDEGREKCVECGAMIPEKEAQEMAEWCEVEFGRPIDEGPICGPCARKLRAQRSEAVKEAFDPRGATVYQWDPPSETDELENYLNTYFEQDDFEWLVGGDVLAVSQKVNRDAGFVKLIEEYDNVYEVSPVDYYYLGQPGE